MSPTIAASRFWVNGPAAMATTATMRHFSFRGSIVCSRQRIVISPATSSTPKCATTTVIAPIAMGGVFSDVAPSSWSSTNTHKHQNDNASRVWFRSFSSSAPESLCPKQIQVRLNEFQDLFVEARMCIEDVKDSLGTVYYEDDADDAREAVDAAIQHFQALLAEITDIDEKNKVLRSNGLKVEQLKGELELTLSGGHDH
mmetsp:Transcript_21868/g.52029  ORF Transcript_21868/g.52029 Transcript_21868/m.52029 type:complete len:199 (-) Transcript_21868:170-766(-)